MFPYTQIGARAQKTGVFIQERDSKQGSKTPHLFSQRGVRTDSAVSFLLAGRGRQGD